MLLSKAIAFDLDNTLVDRDKAFACLLTDWLQNVIGGNACLISCIQELDYHGHASREELFRGLEKLHILEGDSVDLWNRFRREFPRYFEPDPEVHAMLERLKNEGMKLAILTNGGTELQGGKMKHAGLEPFFARDLTLISDETGFEKPEPAAFEQLAERLQCNAEEILFVGDHPETDIHGAAACGFQTCWLENENFGPPKFDFSISRLLELESIIWPATT